MQRCINKTTTMNTTQTLMILNSPSGLMFKPTKWEREEGEMLTIEGRTWSVLGVCSDTEHNRIILNDIFKTINKYNKGAAITKTQNIGGYKIRATVGRKVWESQEAKMEYLFTRMEQLTTD